MRCFYKIIFIFFLFVFFFYPNSLFSIDDEKDQKNNSLHSSKPHTITSLEQASQELNVKEKLGESIHQDITFKDEQNKDVQISDFYKTNQPIIIVPIYYSCPHLCTLILNGLTDALRQEKKYLLGNNFKVISVSFNEEDSFELASKKKTQYIKKLNYPKKMSKKLINNWHFLTGKKEDVFNFYQSMGFQYKKLREEYAHSAVLIFTTPNGKISRYLYGVQYSKNDFRLSLLEAKKEKIASFTEKLFLYCFKYNPEKRKYTIVAWRVMMISTTFIVIVFFAFLGFLWYREKKQK